MMRSALRSSFTPAFRAASSRTSATPSLAQRWMSTESRAALSKAVSSTPVVLFMKGDLERPQCGFSRAAVQVLEMHGVPQEKIKTFDVLQDQQLRADIKEFSEWPTVPQLYVNGEFVGGCDILLSMHQSGDFEELLEKHNIIPVVETADLKPASASSSSS